MRRRSKCTDAIGVLCFGPLKDRLKRARTDTARVKFKAAKSMFHFCEHLTTLFTSNSPCLYSLSLSWQHSFTHYGRENNTAQPKVDECPSFYRLTIVWVLFCSLKKGTIPTFGMLCLTIVWVSFCSLKKGTTPTFGLLCFVLTNGIFF